MAARLARPLPRLLHPGAWWLWGACLAVCASRTTNPFLLVLVVVVAGWVGLRRAEPAGTNAFAPFLVIGLVTIGFRVLMVGLLGDAVPGRVVLVRLPSLPLPAWTSGVRVGGAVTLEGILAATYDGLRLAAVLACLAVTNALASPRRLLRHLPVTLHEVGTTLVVALTFAPQLVADARRVRTARRLRGHQPRALRDLGRLAVPVLVGALDRSLDLAASMESRGYGRAASRPTRTTHAAGLLTVVGLTGVLIGLYGLMDAGSPPLLGAPVLAVGVLAAGAALTAGRRHDRRTHHRRQAWAGAEWLVLLAGALPAGVLLLASAQAWDGITPTQVPVSVPTVPVLLVAAIACGALAGVLTPEPPPPTGATGATS